MRRGFTVLEVAISGAILAALSVVALLAFGRMRARQELNTATEVLVSQMRTARDLALSTDGCKVYFSLTMYRICRKSDKLPLRRMSLPASVTMFAPDWVYFTRDGRATEDVTLILTSRVTGEQRTVHINKSSGFSYEQKLAAPIPTPFVTRSPTEPADEPTPETPPEPPLCLPPPGPGDIGES